MWARPPFGWSGDNAVILVRQTKPLALAELLLAVKPYPQSMVGSRQHPLAARIKRLMQTDEDVGKIAQAAPSLLGKSLQMSLQSKVLYNNLWPQCWSLCAPGFAVEKLVQQICSGAAQLAAERSGRTVTASHV